MIMSKKANSPPAGRFKKVNICGCAIWIRADKTSGPNDVFIAAGPLRDEYGLQQIAETGTRVKWVLDIGAFIGTFSLKAKSLWPSANVIAFEPSAESAALYRLNTAQLKNIVLYEAAAVRRGQSKVVHLVANNSFHAARRVAEVISQFGDSPPAGEPVKAVALVDVLKAHGNPAIELLKIDAEGVEADLLEDLKKADYLKRINWIRGEWHYFPSIPRIEAALRRTHHFHYRKGDHPWGGFAAVRKSFHNAMTST
jgi:FkbM family methyltransferase